jgi:hypothetical protein
MILCGGGNAWSWTFREEAASWTRAVSRPADGIPMGKGDDYNRTMSVLDEKRSELEHYEFMMGKSRGRLAVALDTLTDALTMVGQHGVYCQSARQPGKPAMDIQIVMKGITDAKELITSVMEELRSRQS